MTTASDAAPAEPLDEFRFFAIVGTWMEEDVIASTVRNALAQGVERVYIVDNGSTDETVARARAAGATPLGSFHTEQYDERLRIALMNELVRHVSEATGAPHLWWLWLDADEFPRAQGDETIGSFLERLDRRYRVAGARFFNHYPTPGTTPFVEGEHPIELQPLCEELELPVCSSNHRKHPLLRWDRTGPAVEADLGFHRAVSPQRPLEEPSEPIVIHHFPYRDRDVSLRRLEALCSADEQRPTRAQAGHDTSAHMEARFHSLEAVYAGDWANVHNFMPGRPELGVNLVDWRELQPPIAHEPPPW